MESAITHVFNLNKAEWTTGYFLAPEQAVVCAWYQARGNYNTWDYDFTKAVYGKSGKTVFCGEFSAMLDRCPIGD